MDSAKPVPPSASSNTSLAHRSIAPATADDINTPVGGSQASLSYGSEEPAEKPDRIVTTRLPRLCPTVDKLTFVKRGARFVLPKQTALKNSLLGSVGFLELANAGDFAANVWNDVPVPVYAVVLMALGGTFALILAVLAFRDARLCGRNIRVLREQRRVLRDDKVRRLKASQSVGDVDVLLDMTFREFGNEAINRCGADILMGLGAVLVGVGTLVAIDGADAKAWYVSNLLSGYIGNAPLAVYGLINAAWALHVWRRAGQYRAAGAEVLGGSPLLVVVNRRITNVQIYSAVNAVTAVLGGLGSMMTATMWYGYVILVPVILSSISCNIWWRHRVGYDRPFIGDALGMSVASLIDELEFVVFAQSAVREDPSNPLKKFTADHNSLVSVAEFLASNDLFEDFCHRLFEETTLAAALCSTDSKEVTIDVASLRDTAKEYHGQLLDIAQKCLREVGAGRFQSRERYLVETLGSYLRLVPKCEHQPYRQEAV